MRFSLLRLLFLVILLAFFIALVQFNIVAIAFEKLNLSRESAYLLFMSALIGSAINVPLFSMTRREQEPAGPEADIPSLFGMREAAPARKYLPSRLRPEQAVRFRMEWL